MKNIKIDEPIVIHFNKESTTYTSISQHRIGGYRNKSFWTISLQEEVECFKNMYLRKWMIEFKGWSVLQATDNRLKELGKSKNGEILKLSKFVDSNQNNSWHGYPADYQRNIQDRPPISILEKWFKNSIIEKHQISKILQGKRCNL